MAGQHADHGVATCPQGRNGLAQGGLFAPGRPHGRARVGFVLRAAPPKLAQLSALYGVDGLIGATPA